MAKTRTFVDADVLINAFRALGPLAVAAQDVLDDPGREFVASDILRLELIPKPHFNRQTAEEQFYETYFASVIQLVETTPQIVRDAEREAKAVGLAAADALHVAAAKHAGATEFMTAEQATKPLFRVSGIIVTTIRT